MASQETSDEPRRRLGVTVRGVVQGVGFRPFVYNLARSKNLHGWVLNEADTVQIALEGEYAAIDSFLETLKTNAPPQAVVESVAIADLPADIILPAAFEIRTSEKTSPPRPIIPADLATCAECLAEITDAAQRRFHYPFTNCTNCGPRWSIIESLPYDRPCTSMAGFTMCDACRKEYEDPSDRRFHAQPIACPVCGPHLEFCNPQGTALAQREDALQATIEALKSGKIIALKGLGGFQLLVDATDASAVERLRQKKRRPARPFAVMMPSLAEARRHCEISEKEAKMLGSAASPIVLLKRLPGRNISKDATKEKTIADSVAPGNPYLGVMPPYTPLHHLLLGELDRPLICTSGNLSEEPMVIENADAVKRLGPIADFLLTHNRPIVRPVDDSIVRFGPTGLQVLRRARGFAPLPMTIPKSLPTILAVGGHLKNTVALSLDQKVIVGSHIGDLDSPLSVEVFRRAIDDLLAFYQTKPDAVACDLHPDYASTREAERLAVQFGVPLLRFQHHHAHAAACIAEHELQGPVLAFSWDGTGYGEDGTVWGGEVLLCEGGRYKRFAHLKTFPLPGSERATREPRRSALGVLYEILGEAAAEYVAPWFASQELSPLMKMLERGTNCPRTSSLGRLFDAVSALCGLSTKISFEGEAAMALEFLAEPFGRSGMGKNEENNAESYRIPLDRQGEGGYILDWCPMIEVILADIKQNVARSAIAGRFHLALAEMAVAAAKESGLRTVVLTGGCFQNAFLFQLVYNALLENGFSVFAPRQVPPGDGGIALGQIYLAAEKVVRG